ncbi:MAG: DUF6992 family protein [Myxococcota bacterium]
MLSLALALTLASTPLEAWNAERQLTHRVGMFTLGGWAVANLGVGAVGFALERDERLRFFHLGNLAWNVVNLGLAAVGLAHSYRAPAATLDAKELLLGSEREEKVFFINAALDVAYLATAAFLWQRGDATADARLVGLGQALLVQGGFLLVFDTVMGLLNLRLTDRLVPQLEISPLGVSGTF